VVVLGGNIRSVEFDGLHPTTLYTVEVRGRVKEHVGPSGFAINSTGWFVSDIL